MKDGHIYALIPDTSSIGTDNFIAKESMFHVIGSNGDILMSGRV